MSIRLPVILLLMSVALAAWGCSRDVAPSVSGTSSSVPVEMDPEVRERLRRRIEGDRRDRSLQKEDPVLSTTQWNFKGTDGLIIETAHFRIHTTLPDNRLRRSLPIFMETALAHYLSELKELPPPDAKLDSYIFADRDDWATYTKQRLPRTSDTFLKLGRGGYTTDSDAILFDIGLGDTLAIAAHEGWHQYSQSRFRHPMPIWMEEGMATFMEGHRFPGGTYSPSFHSWRNMERFTALRRAARYDNLIPLAELLEGSPQSFLEDDQKGMFTYYAQVWVLVHFLNEGEGGRYRDALVELIDDAVEGRIAGRLAASTVLGSRARRMSSFRSRIGPAIVLEYFNPDFSEFNEQYDRFLQQVISTGSGNDIWRGRSPVDSP
ncbi:MAG: hypothetical protein CMJ32_07050 [Phycisphaerae bacterium]|nr:hypothetical protein [Phycisphaerae bacterium]